MVTLLLI